MYENLIKRLREYPDIEENASGYVEIDWQDLLDAADTIESLTGQLSAIQSENAEKDKCIDRVEAERDAAMAAMKIVAGGRCCQICSRDCLGHEEISVCTAFEWCGAQEDG